MKAKPIREKAIPSKIVVGATSLVEQALAHYGFAPTPVNLMTQASSTSFDCIVEGQPTRVYVGIYVKAIADIPPPKEQTA